MQVDYITAIDTSQVNPDGSLPKTRDLVLDATPVSELARVANAWRLSADGKRPLLGFLRLHVLVPAQLAEQLLVSCDYRCITVAQTGPREDQGDWYRASEIPLGASQGQPGEFFVRFKPELPARSQLRDLQVLSRFAHIGAMTEPGPFQLNGDKLSLAVYDVGQASFSAIVDEWEMPAVFLDFGWPANFNSASRHWMTTFTPHHLSSGRTPAPVVLSHLDWDHWSYAIESGSARWDPVAMGWTSVPVYKEHALERPWLLRRPKLTHKLQPSHIHFVQALSLTYLTATTVALNFWPEPRARWNFGRYTVLRTKPGAGTPKTASFLRNNEALATLVTGKTDRTRVLFAGDADYPSIAAAAKRDLSGLVAAHHGGSVTPKSVPDALGHGRMVLSVYPGSYSNMPAAAVNKEARAKGWRQAMTSERFTCPRDPHCDTGNRLIRIDSTPSYTNPLIRLACLCLCKP